MCYKIQQLFLKYLIIIIFLFDYLKKGQPFEIEVKSKRRDSQGLKLCKLGSDPDIILSTKLDSQSTTHKSIIDGLSNINQLNHRFS